MKKLFKFFLLVLVSMISFISQAVFHLTNTKYARYVQIANLKDHKNKKALKYDSTLKIGKIGYNLFCSNTKTDQNYLKLKLVGFKTENNPNKAQLQLEVPIKGKVLKAEIDDLNNDGNPDLIIFVQPALTNYVTIFAIRSIDNERIEPIEFPDILDDPKLRAIYKGDDHYTLMEGTLIRSFPFLLDSLEPNSTVKYKKIVYRLEPGLNNILKFRPVKEFISDKP